MFGHVGIVLSAVFDASGDIVLTASTDGTARIWKAKSGLQLVELKGHAGWVNAAAFSADDSRLVTASEDGTARVWEAGSSPSMMLLKGHEASGHLRGVQPGRDQGPHRVGGRHGEGL